MTSPDTERRRQERAARDAQIITAYLAGTHARDLATTHGLTTARIAMILRTRPGIRAERARRDRSARRTQLHRVMAWSRRNVGASVEQASSELGLPASTVRELLGPRVGLHSAPGRRAGRRVYDDAQVEAALRAFVASGGRRRSDYDTQRAKQGWPSSTVLLARYGAWKAAIDAAQGIITPPTANRRRKFSDDDLAGWVARYLDESPGPWTLNGLGRWLTTHEGAPSVGIMRNRMGSWDEIRATAHRFD